MPQLKKPVKQNTENLKMLNKIKGLVNKHHKELIEKINEEMKNELK